MKTAGYILFALGLAGAATTAGHPVTGTSAGERLLEWSRLVALPFAAFLAIAIAGAVLLRKQQRARVERAGADSEQDDAAPEAILTTMLTRLEEVRSAHPGAPTDAAAHAAFHEALDAVLERDVPTFLEHRQRLVTRLGMLRFAEVMGNFSAFERNAARAWSALTDEALDEFEAALNRALDALEATQNQLAPAMAPS